MKTSRALIALTLLGLGSTCSAQLAGVTPEMIATTLPEEGAPKAQPGPYTVSAEPAFGNPGFMTYRPTNLDGFPKHDTLPVVVWGNGGCAIDGARYAGFLSTIASHGFLVLTTAGTRPAGSPPPGSQPAGAPRVQATAANLTTAIDWADQENTRTGSPLNGKIDTQHVAVMGQSCGGVLAITLGADPRVGTIGVFNSGVQGSDPLMKLHGPVLLINGSERDFMMGRSKATYDAIESLPAFYGSRHGAGHTATVFHVGGGEFANVASNWVRWQFKGDRKARAMFFGAKCDLCTNSNWDTSSKHLVK